MDSSRTESWARPEERPFLRRVEDLCDAVVSTQQWKLTDFLTPREQYLMTAITNREGVCVETYGAASHAERRRALLMPDNWYPTAEDFGVALLFASSVSGAPLSHGSVLGSLTGTGLDRRKIGDIFAEAGGVYVAVCNDVAPFLVREWVQAGREVIRVTVVNPETVQLIPPAYEDDVISVSSLRADAVIAHACHWSRTNAQKAIQQGHVMLNFAPLGKVDEPVEVGDLLSIRGFGRLRVLELQGESKKGKLRLRVGTLMSTQTQR